MFKTRPGRSSGRPGNSLIYLTLWLLPVLAIISLCIDFGRVQLAKTELQRSADAAARAGASALGIGPNEARMLAVDYCSSNPVNGVSITINPQTDILSGKADPATGAFTPLSPSNYGEVNAIRVNLARRGPQGVPLLFAGIFGKSSIDITASATVMIDGGDFPPYIGLSMTRMYNNTQFRGYNTALRDFGGSNILSDQTIYGATNLLLDGNALVDGHAMYGPTGTLNRSSGSVVTGILSRNSEQIAKPPVQLGNVVTDNDNAQIAQHLSRGTRLRISKMRP